MEALAGMVYKTRLKPPLPLKKGELNESRY